MNPPLPAVEDILPHRGDMLLLDQLLWSDATRLTAQYRPRPDAWYIQPGGMPSWIGIELMAQAIAAHVGIQKHAQGLPPKPGVLLGTRRYQATQGHFEPSQLLQVLVERQYLDDSGLGAYDARIESKGHTVAHATVKVFEPANFSAFLKDTST